jgi:hypothetical protein
MKEKPEIIAYITENKEIVITGNPLSLYIPDEAERKQVVADIARSLRANVIQLKNGDYIVVSDT